ncbi:TolC family protein [Portibacter lacus]|uniref:Membrane protein n=1 Tax=Portibacter lacus TaxID=1099794 RepID=A0AA37SQN8_9BACT|nr:TolC family protein [Portibacter lacus]GLR17869.1 membrane protein [Portibacter lacus]
MKTFLASFLFLISSIILYSQEDTLRISLVEALDKGLSNALEIKAHDLKITEGELNLLKFNESLKPNFYLDGILPNLSRAIESRPLPDGRDAFVNRSTMYNSIGISADYELPGNFGKLTAVSSIQRLDILRTQTLPYSRNYFFTPFKLGYQYSPFQFDETKWERERINILSEKLTLEKSHVREQIISEIIEKYCSTFELQQELEILLEAAENNDRLTQIQSRLYDLGAIGKIEILRLELEKKILTENIEELKSSLTINMIALNEFIQIQAFDNRAIQLMKPNIDLPSDMNTIEVKDAFANNTYFNYKNYALQKDLEAEINRIDQTKDISLSISASGGANNTNTDIDQLLIGMQDQENLGISFSIPLNGYKERKINLEIAKEQYVQQEIIFAQERQDVEMDLESLVTTFNNLKTRLNYVEDRLKQSEEIYLLSQREYLAGAVTLTDLNDARSQMINDSSNQVSLNLDLIITYFKIRSICLFDFVSNTMLVQ